MAKQQSRKHIITYPNHSTLTSSKPLKSFWIRVASQNQHHYFSPTVAFRKKDVSLRLSFHYRSLNSKAQVDRHPLPRIQDLIDSLKEKRYFSVFDQHKAHKQIYLGVKSRLYLPSLIHTSIQYLKGSKHNQKMKTLDSMRSTQVKLRKLIDLNLKRTTYNKLTSTMNITYQSVKKGNWLVKRLLKRGETCSSLTKECLFGE